MRKRKLSRGYFGLSIAGSLCSVSALASNTPVSVMPITVQLSSEKIGKIKRGIGCFPSFPLRWSALQHPDGSQAAQLVANALTTPDRTFTSVAASPWRVRSGDEKFLRGEIVELAMNVCVPNVGIGEMHAKGKGQIVVRWDLIDSAGGVERSAISKVELNIARRDPRVDASILEDGIIESARSFIVIEHQR